MRVFNYAGCLGGTRDRGTACVSPAASSRYLAFVADFIAITDKKILLPNIVIG